MLRPTLGCYLLLTGCLVPGAMAAPPVADQGTKFSSVTAYHAAEGTVEIYAVARGRILKVKTGVLPRHGRWKSARALGVELYVGDDLSGVLPSGPAVPQAAGLRRSLATEGEIFLEPTADGKLRFSARSLRFGNTPALSVAPRVLTMHPFPP